MTKQVILIGECMAEFSPASVDGLYQQAYAGDAFNTAIYLKRCAADDVDSQFMSVIGKDTISEDFVSLMRQEALSCEGLYRTDTATMGAYMVHLDDSGERSFSYWRKHSAATQITQHLDINDLLQAEYVFFTGITLAILSDEQRECLLATLGEVAEKGVKVVFDPNYRPRLWTSPEVAATSFKQALAFTSVALPGLEDFEALYGLDSQAQVADMLDKLDIPEYVIKDGINPMLVGQNGQREWVETKPVTNVVDSTSAGDSFNGGYLSQRLSGKSSAVSATYASRVSGCVIQHRGAIVEPQAFADFIQQLHV